MPSTHVRSGHAQGRRPVVVDVVLTLIEAEPDDPDSYDVWSAEWGLRDSSTGTEFGSDDLAEVVEVVAGDCQQQFASRYQVQMCWRVNPSTPPATAALAASGIELPTTLA